MSIQWNSIKQFKRINYCYTQQHRQITHFVEWHKGDPKEYIVWLYLHEFQEQAKLIHSNGNQNSNDLWNIILERNLHGCRKCSISYLNDGCYMGKYFLSHILKINALYWIMLYLQSGRGRSFFMKHPWYLFLTWKGVFDVFIRYWKSNFIPILNEREWNDNKKLKITGPPGWLSQWRW